MFILPAVVNVRSSCPDEQIEIMFITEIARFLIYFCLATRFSSQVKMRHLSPQPYYSPSHAAIFGVLSFLHLGLLTANMGLCTILL